MTVRLANVRCWRQERTQLGQTAMSHSVKVFGCRPMTAVPHAPGAGVRKPPRDETAGSGQRSCSRLYGDLGAADEAREGSRRD